MDDDTKDRQVLLDELKAARLRIAALETGGHSALRELADSKMQIDSFFDSSPAGLLILDEQLRYIRVNPALAEINGLSVEAHLGRPIGEVLPKLADVIVPLFQRILTTSEPILNLEVTGEIPRNPGMQRWWTVSYFPTRVEEGRVIAVGGVVIDITDRKLAEQQLRDERVFAERAFDALTDTFFAFRLSDEKPQRWNKSFREVSGYTDEEIAGMRPADFYPPEDRAPRDGAKRQVADEGAGMRIADLLTKDGRLVPYEYSAVVIDDTDGTPTMVAALGRNLTARRALEDKNRMLEMQFIQAQKMEAIGRLAGGVAHDFNNLLTVILTSVKLASMGLRPHDPILDDLNEITAAGDRAVGLTRQLLAFSRRQVLAPSVFTLNETVGQMERMLVRLMGDVVDLQTALEPDLGRINADIGQVEQAIMNLVINARDAMPDGGTVVIETRNLAFGPHNLAPPVTKPGRYVALTITDDGIGIDEETQSQIFEPFFTTKDAGVGTGLGLAMVYGIISQSDGFISVSSEPGKGTTFNVYFPRVDAEATPRRDSESIDFAGGNETILIVEDDAAVRKLTGRLLLSAGYTVYMAANAGEALLYCEQNGDDISLLLCDIVMPQLGGPALVRRLAQLCPHLRVLYMSGYAGDAVSDVMRDGGAFISKPYDSNALLAKIRETLAG